MPTKADTLKQDFKMAVMIVGAFRLEIDSNYKP